MAAKQNTPTLVRGVLQKLKVRIGQSGNLNMEEAYGSNSISYTLRDYNASSATFQMVGTWQICSDSSHSRRLQLVCIYRIYKHGEEEKVCCIECFFSGI